MASMQSLIKHFESTFFSSETTTVKFYGEFDMIHWYAKSMRCRMLIFRNILTARMNMELINFGTGKLYIKMIQISFLIRFW